DRSRLQRGAHRGALREGPGRPAEAPFPDACRQRFDLDAVARARSPSASEGAVRAAVEGLEEEDAPARRTAAAALPHLALAVTIPSGSRYFPTTRFTSAVFTSASWASSLASKSTDLPSSSLNPSE